LRGDHLRTGLWPLVCLAGVLASFRIGADDSLRRFSWVDLSASTARRATPEAGRRLAERQRQGDVATAGRWPARDSAVKGRRHTVAYLGRDAFSVPRQGPRGAKAEGRLLYSALLYTPNKAKSPYLADVDLGRLGAQRRPAAQALGLEQAHQRIAVTDAGNGIAACIRRHFWDDLLCVLDWYHACEHLRAYAQCLCPRGAAARRAGVKESAAVWWERGGTGLLAHRRGQAEPADEPVARGRRQLIHSSAENAHRTDYPSYQAQGYDSGSGPVASGCQVVGDRLKRSGRRWVAAGAADVAPPRALDGSGEEVWDASWGIAA
jgi:hypothetical protein